MNDVRALQDAGQVSESIEPLREILAENPDLPEANHRLGAALVQVGQPSLAVWPLEKAAQSQEFAVPSGILLASAFLNIQGYEDAVRAADRVLAIDPERTAALQIRAHANLGSGRHDDALADTTRLVELLPDDYQAALLYATVLSDMKKVDEAEKAHVRLKQIGEKSGDAGLAARGCLALATFYKDDRKDTERAERGFEECLEAYPTDPLALRLGVQFFDERKRPEEGTALIREAMEEAPENPGLRMQLAQRLRAAGKRDEAEQVLVEATETFGTPAAWQALAQFHRSSGEKQAAADAIEKAVDLAGGANELLRFEQADILVDLGDLERAEKVADTLEESTYRDLVRGRIALERGDAAAALAAFDNGIRRWPNNAGARYLAGIAARDLGDFDRAVSELRESVRVDPRASDAALALAGIHLARGEGSTADGFVRLYFRDHETPDPQAYVIFARILTAQGKFEDARRSVAELRKVDGQQLAAAVELAGIERKAQGPQAAVASIEKSDLDLQAPENLPALRSLVGDLLTLGKNDAALAKVDAALAAHPQAAGLHELRGGVLARSGKTDAARSAFEQAVALDATSAEALSGLGTLAANAGDAAGAIALFDRAASAKPGDSTPAYHASQLVLASGKSEEAERRLREIVRKDLGHAGARNDLAWLLAEQGRELDLALSLAEQARKIDASPDVLDTLGWVQLKRGEFEPAVESFQQALAGRSDSASIRYHLGLALSRMGQKERALETLREAVGSGPFPEAEAARQEIARLEQP